MPAFVVAWLGSSGLWSGLLVFDEGFRIVGLVAALAAETAVLALMLRARRFAGSTARVRSIALAACVALGWIVLAVFAAGGGSRDVLGVRLLTLYVLPAFAFGWGWRWELALELATAVPAAALFAAFAPSVRPAELAVAYGLGSVIALGVAEATARNLRVAHRHRLAADTRTRELRASRNAYRDLAENVHDLIWAFDLEGRWTFLNAAAERFFGRPREEMIGRSVLKCVVPGSPYPPFEGGLARLASGAPARLVRIHCATASGPRWIEAFGSGVFAADGTLLGMRGVGRDVTERVEIDARLAESEAKFRTVAEAVTTPVFVFSGRHLRYVNAAAMALIGYSEAELFAMPFWDILHPDDRALARERGMARQHGEQFPPSLDYRLMTKSGEIRWVEFTAVQTEFEGTPAILGTAVDVTERRRAEDARQASLDELRLSEERLRRLARRQVQIREDERKRLGFDLHDGVCQELIGIAIMIHSVRDRVATSGHVGVEVLERAVAYLHTVVEHLRLLARELRPMLLQDLGLADGLASLAAGLTTRERDVAVRVVTPIPRLADDVELAVYRIAQEALTNAVRHAEARKVVATVTCRDGDLRLEIRDDGRGFDVDARSGDALGLTGMQERAAALGGRLSVVSAVGEGTVVTLTCPVAEHGATEDPPAPPSTIRPLRYG